jgi:hypothetical protein
VRRFWMVQMLGLPQETAAGSGSGFSGSGIGIGIGIGGIGAHVLGIGLWTPNRRARPRGGFLRYHPDPADTDTDTEPDPEFPLPIPPLYLQEEIKLPFAHNVSSSSARRYD